MFLIYLLVYVINIQLTDIAKIDKIFKSKLYENNFQVDCESGGIGRRAGFRIQWATVGVRVPPFAPFFYLNLHFSLAISTML
jgi:hypothetical protein